MTDQQEPEGEEPANIENAMDMPHDAGRCAYLGGYVEDGETVCYFGEEYICRAPDLVKTGNSC